MHLTMAQDAEKQLRLAHDGLEQRVEERTKQLSAEIVERSQAEKALTESEGRLQAILHNTDKSVSLSERLGNSESEKTI